MINKRTLILIFVLFLSSLSAEMMKVTFIDVLQGDAILIQRDSSNYLIDSGKSQSSDKLQVYLFIHHITHLNACMMSHPDIDHTGEFEDLILSNYVTIDKFIKNSDDFTSQAGLDLMTLIDTLHIPVQVVNTDSTLNWAVDTQILNPLPSATGSTNNNSIVLKMIFGNISFLFTGDMESSTITRILNTYDMNIDVLKVSHHGSTTGTTTAFLAEATPAISVILSGNNSYGHPSYTVTDMLTEIGSQIFSTADDWNTWAGNGSNDITDNDDIVLDTDGNQVWINGTLVWTAVPINDQVAVSQDMSLRTYPNPFNNSSTISYKVPHDSNISLSIYNLKGQKIRSLEVNQVSEEVHQVAWDGRTDTGSEVPNGVYICNLKGKDVSMSRKITLIK